MEYKVYDFDYNVSINTINSIKSIDFTYHVNNFDYQEMHTHSDYWEFTVVSNGTIENNRNGSLEEISKDMLFISSTHDIHSFKKISDDILIINIICREEAIKNIINNNFPNYYDLLDKGKKVYNLSKNILYMINNNIELVNSIGDNNWKIVNEILRSTIVSIVSYLYLIDLKSTLPEKKWEIILNSLKMDEKFYSYNVNQLCERTGYSRVQLNRIFKSEYNLTPYEYLLDCKMEYAASLLTYTNYTVSEISHLTGYSNQSQFNEHFKNKYGDTPLNYRDKIKKSQDTLN